MRGYGQSDRPVQAYDMEVWADDVAGLLDALELQEAHVHGTSMGGMIAIVFAAKYPERTISVVTNCAAAQAGAASIDTIQRSLRDSSRIEVFTAACQAMCDMDLRPYLSRITSPALVLGGDEDLMTPWDQGPGGAGQEAIFEGMRD